MTPTNFLENNFPNLKLESPLFYSWKPSIRFELGVNESSLSIHENPVYLPGVYRRAIDLFEALHAPEDELYLVVDVYDFGEGSTLQRKLNVFAKYVKHQSILYRLQHETFLEENEDESYRIHRFSWRCHRSDFHYAALLKAICNQDMGKSPSIHYPIYFLNETKGTIYYVYDDRGCDLLGVDTETIRWIYNEFNEWILDYDRVEINKTFS